MTQRSSDKLYPSKTPRETSAELGHSQQKETFDLPNLADRENPTLITPEVAEIYQRLNVTPQQITEFCKRWGIAELAVFGSILRADFRKAGSDASDVDLLFTYGENSRKNLILQIRMKFELEDLFHRSVDLVSKTAIVADPNFIRRQNILESTKVIYAER